MNKIVKTCVPLVQSDFMTANFYLDLCAFVKVTEGL